MNTPAHILINLPLLTPKNGELGDRKCFWSIFIGAFFPDAAMIIFFFAYLIIGKSSGEIFAVEYFRPGWQKFFNAFNSIPIYIFLGVISLLLIKSRPLFLFSISAVLHCLLDLPLHYDDGHAHFFPITEWVFQSPLSYWDPRRNGGIVGTVEGLLSLGLLSLFLKRFWVQLSRLQKGVLFAIGIFEFPFLVFSLLILFEVFNPF